MNGINAMNTITNNQQNNNNPYQSTFSSPTTNMNDVRTTNPPSIPSLEAGTKELPSMPSLATMSLFSPQINENGLSSSIDTKPFNVTNPSFGTHPVNDNSSFILPIPNSFTSS